MEKAQAISQSICGLARYGALARFLRAMPRINREARVEKRQGRQQAVVAVLVAAEVCRAFPALVDQEVVPVVVAVVVAAAVVVVALSKSEHRELAKQNVIAFSFP